VDPFVLYRVIFSKSFEFSIWFNQNIKKHRKCVTWITDFRLEIRYS